MKKTIFFSILSLLLWSCKKTDSETDTQKPVISIAFAEANPIQCDTAYFGDTLWIHLDFGDNVELGSYNIDMHHNFDHHSHSTQVQSCELAPIKNAVNPLVYISSFSIPNGLKQYRTHQAIVIPSQKNGVPYDEGDYHFFVSLTDAEGWSAQLGLSIKLLHSAF